MDAAGPRFVILKSPWKLRRRAVKQDGPFAAALDVLRWTGSRLGSQWLVGYLICLRLHRKLQKRKADSERAIPYTFREHQSTAIIGPRLHFLRLAVEAYVELI
jgi:hypothetical protein